MSRDNISTGELDRTKVIIACKATQATIVEERRQLREKVIARHMNPRQSWLARKIGMAPITRTREEAEKLADEGGDGLFGPEHEWLYGGQFTLAGKLLRLARASDAPTVRVTRDDFEQIRVGWPS